MGKQCPKSECAWLTLQAADHGADGNHERRVQASRLLARAVISVVATGAMSGRVVDVEAMVLLEHPHRGIGIG